jgi:hypothetical protein
MMIDTRSLVEQAGLSDWPREIGLIISAMEAGGSAAERREIRRNLYRVKAMLRLFTDSQSEVGKVLYTRDVNQRSLGFITSHRLPLGYGGTLQLPTPQGKIETIHCTLLRCRQAAPGWYEGSLYFNRERNEFAANT